MDLDDPDGDDLEPTVPLDHPPTQKATPPPAEPEPRARKRDLPLKVIRFVSGLFGG